MPKSSQYHFFFSSFGWMVLLAALTLVIFLIALYAAEHDSKPYSPERTVSSYTEIQLSLCIADKKRSGCIIKLASGKVQRIDIESGNVLLGETRKIPYAKFFYLKELKDANIFVTEPVPTKMYLMNLILFAEQKELN
jgi:membrane-associated HD superfamily phosphohydrolase